MTQPSIICKTKDGMYHICGAYGVSEVHKFTDIAEAKRTRNQLNRITKKLWKQHPDWRPEWL